MELFTIFKNCILLPRKEALFRLNRVSMRNTLTYMFVLIFILFIPSIITSISEANQLTESDMKSLYVIQVIILYPFTILFMIMAFTSILAVSTVLIKNLLGRKLKYQQLWKMTAFALTQPLLIYALFQVFGFSHPMVNFILFIMIYFLIYKMILTYPKAVKK
ncbi:DUF1189 family protein [Aquibacillus kalidii]|uniref:DUF1189 family protein n=1 Tax=Aquibacillus kalidii TaxID=2762597 RepID=UPI001647ADEB|nr:DUF1189 family protein [Aquibacillus kalidii]